MNIDVFREVYEVLVQAGFSNSNPGFGPVERDQVISIQFHFLGSDGKSNSFCPVETLEVSGNGEITLISAKITDTDLWSGQGQKLAKYLRWMRRSLKTEGKKESVKMGMLSDPNHPFEINHPCLRGWTTGIEEVLRIVRVLARTYRAVHPDQVGEDGVPSVEAFLVDLLKIN